MLIKKNPLKYVQLNKYEKAPNFIQLNQNLTLDCYLFVDLAELTCFVLICRTILWSHHARTWKFR